VVTKNPVGTGWLREKMGGEKTLKKGKDPGKQKKKKKEP